MKYNRRTSELIDVLAMQAGRIIYNTNDFAQYELDDDFQYLDINLEAGIVTYDFVIRPYDIEALTLAKKEDRFNAYVNSLQVHKKQLVISTAKLFELYCPILELD